ncbi:MAG: alpha/beta hydrolase [Bacteroidetes bacterium]|nr:alpha/beta hydrolase [Bacteroidota bacterium]MBL7136891.1 alpha/beta hydrolase [Candidatus Neomarinimicrobiota bacterium]
MRKYFFSIIICLITLTFTKGQQVNSFITSDNESIYFTRIGNGPKVVLLYGGPGYAVSAMRPWADSLSNEFECILYDQRGTGLSSNVKFDSTTINLLRAVKDIDELRKYLGEDKLTICGISWGGMLAQAYASFYPENTKKIVLVSTLGPDLSLMSAFVDNMNMRRYPEEMDSLLYWNNMPDNDLAKMKRSFYTYLPEFYDHDIGQKMLPEFFATTTYHEQMENLMWKDLYTSYDLKSSLKNYKGSCFIIRARQDPVPAEEIYRIKEILPQTKIIIIEKCGHFPDYEKPIEFFVKLRKVLG